MCVSILSRCIWIYLPYPKIFHLVSIVHFQIKKCPYSHCLCYIYNYIYSGHRFLRWPQDNMAAAAWRGIGGLGSSFVKITLEKEEGTGSWPVHPVPIAGPMVAADGPHGDQWQWSTRVLSPPGWWRWISSMVDSDSWEMNQLQGSQWQWWGQWGQWVFSAWAVLPATPARSLSLHLALCWLTPDGQWSFKHSTKTRYGTARAPDMSSGYAEWLKGMSQLVGDWQNMIRCRREWQTTSVFLPWEPHEQAKRFNA